MDEGDTMSGMSKEKTALYVGLAATAFGTAACFQAAGEQKSDAQILKSVRDSATLTLAPTQTLEIQPSSTADSNKDIATRWAAIEATQTALEDQYSTLTPLAPAATDAQKSTNTEIPATSTATATSTETPRPTPTVEVFEATATSKDPVIVTLQKTVAVQSDVVQPNEGDWNNVNIEPVTYENINEIWARQLDLYSKTGDGDSFKTSIENQPRMDANGNPILRDDTVNPDHTKEYGLGQSIQDLRKYRNILEVLTQNPKVMDLYWKNSNGTLDSMGFYGLMNDRDAMLAVAAAVELFVSNPEIPGDITINDLLSKYSPQIQTLEREMLGRTQKRSLGTSSEETARQNDPKKPDASKHLPPELKIPDQNEACVVVREDDNTRNNQLNSTPSAINQPQVLRVEQFTENGTELGQVHGTTNDMYILGATFDGLDSSDIEVKAFTGRSSIPLYKPHNETNGEPTMEATLLPYENSALNDQLISCYILKDGTKITATATAMAITTETQTITIGGPTPPPGETPKNTEVVPTRTPPIPNEEEPTVKPPEDVPTLVSTPEPTEASVATAQLRTPDVPVSTPLGQEAAKK